MSMIVKENSVVLFQGDSTTDCCRDRENGKALGPGYPLKISNFISDFYSDFNVTFLNRGIIGNRVRDLKDRWQQDCLDLKPDVVTIMIGINDCWRRFDENNDPTTAEEFENDYRVILKQTQKVTSNLILMDPFVLPFPEDRKGWRIDLDPKIQVVRSLAREFHAILIPLDAIFATAIISGEPQYYTKDGVHPTDAGHSLIAKQWLKAVGAV